MKWKIGDRVKNKAGIRGVICWVGVVNAQMTISDEFGCSTDSFDIGPDIDFEADNSPLQPRLDSSSQSCQCSFCAAHDRLESVIATRDAEKLIAELREMENKLSNAEMDLSRAESILHGDWPQAVEMLERALCNARRRQG